MAVGNWILISLFGCVFIFGAVLGIHLRGFAKGYKEGYEDCMEFLRGELKNEQTD